MAYTELSAEAFSTGGENPSVIDGFLEAFSTEFDELTAEFDEFELLNYIDMCSGVQLDRIGQLVGLTRHEAGQMIGSRELADDDKIYSITLKYKAYVNSCRCTPNDIINATKIIFGATQVLYSERTDTPATFYLSVSAPFSDIVMTLLSTHDLIIHPAGVKVRTSLSTKDTDTFGFSDLNPNVCGFGNGKFAQSIM